MSALAAACATGPAYDWGPVVFWCVVIFSAAIVRAAWWMSQR